ncbi:CysJI operon transcriptional activator [Thalassovita gelatinovora]|uniref:CysJI operon transcriptional activator n=1 Tax=Thalassovita gelatinovora TaxID=53501 RepID=A0A0P1FIP4_THAGE|nr:LysR family transcriptional regulator [Thalassovita gelatinovora]QIZ82180.1 LysR family transcriptional regulator [Thalassovita gelatinovora]CUH67798.1 CysJI operon transcriptional activator [Thalassovita gelatinovora]SEP67153.1 DNA-binding transcriptional regulator, LysR family [Thalassovita gelatinovora]
MKPYEQRFPWQLDWNLLRTFMVVVEQRGISRAADFLGLKQPTISSALKRLEQAMGQRLIIRKPNEFKVTRAGQILYSECSSIFGSVSQLPALLEVTAEELRGHISVAIASHVKSDHFDDVLHDFAKRHPKVTFSFTVAESEEVASRISQNRTSLGICLLQHIPPNLKASVLYREYFGLFCGPRHRLFDRENIALSDLAGEPSVSFQTEVENGPLEPVARLRARANIATGWRGVSSNLHELRRMIVSDIGIGALPLHVAARDVERGRLRQLPPYDDLPLVNIYLLTNPARRLSDAEATFLTICEDAIASVDLQDRTYR